MNGDEARAKLRATVDSGGVIIGAGAGTGLSAKCAEAGGTDLIIIYNSGPLPDGGARLAGRADALRRRQRDRHGDGRARCCPWSSTPRCWPAYAAPTRFG